MKAHLGDDARLAAEARARTLIDRQLGDAGWVVQDKKALNLFAAQGVACREVTMKTGHGRADYLLYVDQRVVGVIEAKPQGTTLSGVEWQSAMYAEGLPADVRLKALTRDGRLPFVFEASGTETHFTNGYDPDPRARQLFGFPQPETLARIVRDAEADPDAPTWRAKMRDLPALDTSALRPAQITAITGVEQSLAAQHFDRSLVQMATGAGKTYTAVTLAYRLLKYGGFKRILFLVDRNNLADQTAGEFSNYRMPGDGRSFTDVYAVDKLTRAGMLASSNVVISTIQRVYKALQGDEVTAEDDPGLDDFVPDSPVTVAYSPQLPPETFDLVVVDEAHRSIYGVWRGVLEYFDAHVVGLTATPGKQTFAFFRQNLVSEYTYPQSVADRVNVDFDVYRIRTEISERGGLIEATTVVPKVDRRTRKQRLEALEEDLEYTSKQLDRAVTAKSQIRLVLETFSERLFTEIFPGRSTVTKTLIFAKDDAHAEEIVTTVREVFGKGNDFAAKITYNAKDPKGQLQAFRTSPSLRIAVTVDMIATGTDVKPLECVFFMRDVRSAQYFEQMKGRGARTIAPADFQSVTPDASGKTRFVIVDAVGVTEHDFADPPLNREKGVSLKKLLDKAATLSLTEDETATLASRLAKLELDLTPAEREELDDVAGVPVRDIVRGLVDAVDPDTQAEAAAGQSDPESAIQRLLDDATRPLAANPELRGRILELRATHDRVIDEVNADTLLSAGGVVDTNRARSVVESWQAYLEQHRDEITAIQLLGEARERRIDFADIQELADRISRPPHNWTTDFIWAAYETIDVGRVRHSDRHTLTDLVSLLRYTVGVDDELVPYADRVRERYAAWLAQQHQSGVNFTETQRWWLDRMVEVIANSAGITAEDLDEAPFTERGGVDGALRDLGDEAADLLENLNAELTA
ncbi:type I restriction-modification enzyme R subunit C-terminal domain-containing protein [Yimella sp. cx-51]|uniref:type I restriction endonuclease subunit R n=1 Tax=Yimella sp. cx-51 TaxID=2770551 RepID=UPI00165E382A|nr:type I restriction-modification enzyme R subunit C-terminal domain-containing protein [Yimella sp. cx-51]MBC9956444.1 DEAD/DEAH box helicase family protein [Yimella sp. cx-51]QTH38440.1 DEAD/DEAH box helicase family protein [Yimella sp. cx-51]